MLTTEQKIINLKRAIERAASLLSWRAKTMRKWIEDIIGALCLFGTFYALMFLPLVLG